MSRKVVKALVVVKSILFLVLGFLIGMLALSAYGILAEPKHLTCVYLNATTGDSGGSILIMGMGNQTLVVKNSVYASVVRVDGVMVFPITINEPPHTRVLVLSTRCNPYLRVSLVFPNGTAIYGKPQPINDQ
jgi:Na+/H+ antiporter NhaC